MVETHKRKRKIQY